MLCALNLIFSSQNILFLFIYFRWSYGILLYEIFTIGMLHILPSFRKNQNFNCSFAFVSCCAIPIIFYPKKLFRNQSILYLSIKYLLYFIGGTPYPGVKGRDVHSLLKEGYRIEKPRHVNKELYVYLFLNIQ